MAKPRRSIVFFFVLLIGLLPSIVCGNRPTPTLTITEYEISKETGWLIDGFASKDIKCSHLLIEQARDLEPGVRVINTGRGLDCRNGFTYKGTLIHAYLIEVEKLSSRGEPFWVPEDVLEGN